jgi:hypothetical protein
MGISNTSTEEVPLHKDALGRVIKVGDTIITTAYPDSLTGIGTIVKLCNKSIAIRFPNHIEGSKLTYKYANKIIIITEQHKYNIEQNPENYV